MKPLPKNIAILNVKGGVGKSTLTASIASILLSSDVPTSIIDSDPSQCLVKWGERIKNIKVFSLHNKRLVLPTSKIKNRYGKYCSINLIDTPANIPLAKLTECLKFSHKILIPVHCSPIEFYTLIPFYANIN